MIYRALLCCFLFALWGRRVCCLFWKMGIKRCEFSACERQRKALEAEVLNSAPEAQVGLAVTLWACGGAEASGRSLQGGPALETHPHATPRASERLLIFPSSLYLISPAKTSKTSFYSFPFRICFKIPNTLEMSLP